MTVVYRKALPAERDAYVALADMAFSAFGTPISFERALPKVYAPGVDSAWMHRVAVSPDGDMRALIAALPGQLHVLEQTLRTGFVGTVCVHPEYRGQGHMTRLLQDTLHDLQDQGCDLALLDGARQRYEHFGFTPGGLGYRVMVTRHNVHHALAQVEVGGITFVELLPDSDLEAQAMALHQALPCRFDRSGAGFAVTCRSYGNTPYGMLQGSRLVGYAVSNADGGFLHEALTAPGFSLDQLLKAWLLTRQLKDVTLRLPAWQHRELAHVAQYAEEISAAPCTCAHILHYRPVVEALLRLKSTYTALEDGTLPLCCEGQSFTLIVRQNVVSATDGAVHPLMLDGLSAGRFLLYPFPCEGQPAAPHGWFPLPLYTATPDTF